MNIRKFIFIFTGSLFIFCDGTTSKNEGSSPQSHSSQSKIPTTSTEESDTTLSEKLKEKNNFKRTI